MRGLKSLTDFAEREAMRNQVLEAQPTRCEQAHADAHSAQDGRLFTEMSVQNLKRHPVPVAKRDLARFTLVEADDDHLAAHACDIAQEAKWCLRPHDFEGHISALSICQCLDSFRQWLLCDIDHMRSAQ